MSIYKLKYKEVLFWVNVLKIKCNVLCFFFLCVIICMMFKCMYYGYGCEKLFFRIEYDIVIYF